MSMVGMTRPQPKRIALQGDSKAGNDEALDFYAELFNVYSRGGIPANRCGGGRRLKAFLCAKASNSGHLHSRPRIDGLSVLPALSLAA